MELAARGESPNCPIAIQDAWRTGRLRRSVLPGRSVHRRTNESPRVPGGSRPELACPCPLVNVGPGNPASEGTCVEPTGRNWQSPCRWRRPALPDVGVKPNENKPVSTTSSSPGSSDDATAELHIRSPTWFVRNVRHVCAGPSFGRADTARSSVLRQRCPASATRRGCAGRPRGGFPYSCVE
jgi:hypothetical protein